ncbi:MAG TPA: adenosylcobinamide-GDP ribazoletransferase [Roseiarcus sp.]|nr:adenosylcobinamide-GDP ribazoletransferase [Roseiarcus sp.]
MPSSAADAIGGVADALRFFTRLPLPATPRLSLDFNRIAWAAPVAGAIVGVLGACVLALTQILGLPPVVGASLATAALVAATGALHEDGLADVADGFGGGATREQRLEIMRDSRIGAYGAIALALALVIRVGALASVVSGGFWSAAGALTVVAAVSRAGALAPLAFIDPARLDGAGAAAGRLEPASFAAACGAALVLAALIGLLTVGAGRAIDAAIAGALGAAAMTALASWRIGGQTGDVAGAAQQWAEIAGWCGLLMGRFGA